MAVAGPNAGGILVVHFTGQSYTTDQALPIASPAPANCAEVNTQAPVGIEAGKAGYLWKVYAVFPTGSSPRLKGLSWGMNKTADTYILGASLPSPSDFEVTQGGWPNTAGASIGESFPSGAKTTQISEIYDFVGYGYAGASFCTQPHAVQEPVFVDDAVPANKDLIAGYGCMGFGVPGSKPCPPEPGSCCDRAGLCTITFDVDCVAPSVWTYHGICEPNSCPQPGSCCQHDGTCTVTMQTECNAVWTLGGICDPNSCPQPDGACCSGSPTYVCAVTKAADCATGFWTMDATCAPAPAGCDAPVGSCCFPDGTCQMANSVTCTATFLAGGVCQPNTCVQPDGACCNPYTCVITKAADCTGTLPEPWVLTMFGTCDVVVCKVPPAEAACCVYGWINGMLNHCVVTTEAICMANNPKNQWGAALTCEPNPCTFVPTEQKTWGEIKNIYR